MMDLANLRLSVVIALAVALAMAATSVVIIFYHGRKEEELDQWIDFSFSRDTLRRALNYYRFMALSMLVFYVLFTCSLLYLQADGYALFSDGRAGVVGGPIATAMFCLDLVLRGGFFDIMEHFELRVTALYMLRGQTWFWWYAFVFRMFYGLTLLKMLFSFAWIYGKARLARQAQKEALRAERRRREALRGS
jgi:hypothetical protein